MHARHHKVGQGHMIARRLFPLGCLLLAWLLAPAARAQVPPPKTDPGEVVVAADGSAWLAEDGGGVLRVPPDGTTQAFLHHDHDFVNGLTATADGAVWVTRYRHVVRFDPSGRVTHFPNQGGDAITPAAPDAVWIAYDDPM